LSSITSISKQRTKQSIQGQLPVMALEFPFPPKRASSSTSVCPPCLMHNVSSSSTRSRMAFSATVLIRGTDDAINNPMASLKGISLAYQNGRSRRRPHRRRLFPISLVATLSSSSSSSSTSTTTDVLPPSINSMALHSLGSERMQFLRWESNVYLAHWYASSSLPLPSSPPSPPPLYGVNPLPCPMSLLSPMAARSQPLPHPLSSLSSSSSSNKLAMLSRHINCKRIPQCLSLSWPPPEEEEKDKEDNDNEEKEEVAPMGSRPSW
jgi:hypothetical protein